MRTDCLLSHRHTGFAVSLGVTVFTGRIRGVRTGGEGGMTAVWTAPPPRQCP